MGVPIVGDCASGSTTACDPIVSSGLCLNDGTPIIVVASRNCTTGDVTEVGWLNALNGVFNAGSPPAGTSSCGSRLEFELGGLLCDVDAGGDVVGTCLLEIEYDTTTGAIIGTRLVNAVTGATYIPVGTVGPCTTTTILRFTEMGCFTTGGVSRTVELIKTVNNATGTIISVVPFDIDGTPIVIGPGDTLTLGSCGVAEGTIRSLNLCDAGALPPTEFLRTQVLDATGAVVATIDTEADGTTAYAVIGPIDFDCPCSSSDVNNRLRHEWIVGIGSFALPANAISITVNARDVAVPGSVTITDTDGVYPLKDAETLTFSVVRDQDFTIVGPWTLNTTNVGDEVLITWTEAI